MFELKYSAKFGITPERLKAGVVSNLILSLERAADIYLGKLQAASMTGAIHARSGMLAREWHLIRDGANPLKWILRNRLPYSRILEYGGEIRPVKAGALAVPVEGGPALTERGVSRFPGGPRQAEAAGHNLFIPRGKALLAEHIGAGQMEVWYVLKQQVTIPAFHYASQATEAAKPAVVAEVRRGIKK